MAEKKRFSDQVVWVVGASSGFGAALAHGFDQAGARLLLSARRAERLESQAAAMRQAVAVPLDLAQQIMMDAEYNSDRKAQDVGEYGMPLPVFNAYRALARQARAAIAAAEQSGTA